MRTTQESRSRTINLGDDDVATVRRMLTYLYNSDYDDDGAAGSPRCYMLNVNSENATTVHSDELTALPEPEARRHHKLMNNVVVYAIAEKYNIVKLKELARAKFGKCLAPNPLELRLPPIVSAVYGTTPSTDQGLRGAIVSTCVFRAEDILGDADARCMVEQHGQLGLGMLLELAPLKKNTVRLRGEIRNLKSGMQEVFDYLSELDELSNAYDKCQLSAAFDILRTLMNSPEPLEE